MLGPHTKLTLTIRETYAPSVVLMSVACVRVKKEINNVHVSFLPND